MKHVKFFVAVGVLALVMALLEIQIEGGKGWASGLPTWRLNVSIPVIGMWGGMEKQITGYHVYLWLFSFLLTHIAFLFSRWSWKKEAYILAFYSFFTTLEGWLWFGLNPAFGWGTFVPGKIPWYQELWMAGLPAEYWIRLAGGAGLYWWANKDETGKD